MKPQLLLLTVLTAAILSACGGSSGGADDPAPSVSAPEPEPASLDSIGTVEATETEQTEIQVSWDTDDDLEFTVAQSQGPELGIETTDKTVRLSLPEVTASTHAQLTIELIQDGEVIDSQTVDVAINNDNSRLYADSYHSLKLNDQAVHETDAWRAAQLGLNVYDIQQFDPPRSHCYPSPTDCFEFTNFSMMVGDNVRGDFNNDDLEDLAVSISYSPHRAQRDLNEYPGTVFIFQGTESGGLELNNEIILEHEKLVRHQPYRMAVADFNGDGADDLVVSGGALPASEEQQAEGELFVGEELPIILLSNGQGQLVDATDKLDMTIGDGSSAFGHNLAVGDINNDGHMDFYVGMSVVLNNGDGTFTEDSNRYFTENSQWSTPLASAAGDMNGDGLTDLAILDYSLLSFDDSLGRSQILLSNHSGDSLARDNSPQVITLPEGYWGNDITHTNYALMADLIDEHPGDELLVSQTRLDKYYDGRYLRLFAITDKGDLVEETERLINNSDRLGQRADSNNNGEGTFYILDFNKDGLDDIVDLTGGESNCTDLTLCSPGLSVFYNDGNGNYVYQRLSDVPYLMYNDLVGYDDGSPRSQTLGLAMPWDSGNPVGYDLLTRLKTLPQEYMRQGDKQQVIWYLLEQKENGL
ncbi:VCBS repeat-containing protein [Idiomarina seosinensis]|uniref:FG-GAP repeat domain-containing protein n=1 Tax=Idiomarina seosinensis TaxID=281739 RepID=UPI00385096F7